MSLNLYDKMHDFTTEESLTEEMSAREQQAFYRTFAMRCCTEAQSAAAPARSRGTIRRTLIGAACAAALGTMAVVTASANGLRGSEVVPAVQAVTPAVQEAVKLSKPTTLTLPAGKTPAVAAPHEEGVVTSDTEDAAYRLTLDEMVLDEHGKGYMSLGITYADGSPVPAANQCWVDIELDNSVVRGGMGKYITETEDGMIESVQCELSLACKGAPNRIVLKLYDDSYTFYDITLTEPGYLYWEEEGIRLSALSMAVEEKSKYAQMFRDVILADDYWAADPVAVVAYADGTEQALDCWSYGEHLQSRVTNPGCTSAAIMFCPEYDWAMWPDGFVDGAYCFDLERFESITIGNLTLNREDAVYIAE